MVNPTLDFLYRHANKQYTPEVWAKLLKVEIIDGDGWRASGPSPQKGWDEPLGLSEFIERLALCTTDDVSEPDVDRDWGRNDAVNNPPTTSRYYQNPNNDDDGPGYGVGYGSDH
jgi:hypothetical protein